VEVEDQVRAGQILHTFRTNLHVSCNISCTTLPKRFQLYVFQQGERVRNIHNNVAAQDMYAVYLTELLRCDGAL